jgi:hypothetical protein
LAQAFLLDLFNLKHEFVVDLEEHMRAVVCTFCSLRYSTIFTIASFTMSACVPCIGALIAMRSAAARTYGIGDLMPSKYLRRPKVGFGVAHFCSKVFTRRYTPQAAGTPQNIGYKIPAPLRVWCQALLERGHSHAVENAEVDHLRARRCS